MKQHKNAATTCLSVDEQKQPKPFRYVINVVLRFASISHKSCQ
jgi:hypothetical protein